MVYGGRMSIIPEKVYVGHGWVAATRTKLGRTDFDLSPYIQVECALVFWEVTE